jgi:hypothetical protein
MNTYYQALTTAAGRDETALLQAVAAAANAGGGGNVTVRVPGACASCSRRWSAPASGSASSRFSSPRGRSAGLSSTSPRDPSSIRSAGELLRADADEAELAVPGILAVVEEGQE